MKKCRMCLFALLFFLFLTFLFTYPTVFHPSKSIYGVPQFHADPFGLLWEIWWYRYARSEGISASPVVSIIAYPWGWDRAGDPRLPVLEYMVKILSRFFNEIFTYNLIIWFGFIGTSIGMYCLMYYFSRDWFVSLITGIMFSFSQDHLMHSMQHLGFGLLLWVLLYIRSLFMLFDAPSYKKAFWCGLLYCLLLFTNYYYGYFMMIATVIFLLLRFFKYGLSFMEIKYLFITVILISLFSFQFICPIVARMISTDTSAAGGYYEQPYQDLAKYAARWQDYILPSEFHPLFGGWVKRYVEKKWEGRHYFERSLYIGFMPLLFSLLTLIKWKRIKKLYPKYSFLMSYFLSVIIICFIFSLSPVINIMGLKIPMPSFILYKYLPMFRVYSRFGILVILGIIALAGIGIKYMLDTIKKRRRRNIVMGCILLFVLVELINFPPFHNIDLMKTPSAYEWLQKQPGDVVIVEYPWVRKTEDKNSDYLFYQRIHKKRLINGAPEGVLSDAFRKQCIDPSEIKTAKLLAYLGADFLFLHKDFYIRDYLKKINENTGLELVKDFSDEGIYKIVAKPDDLCIVFWNNFANLEKWDDGNYWRWIGNNATIWVNVTERKTVNIEFKILSFAKTRELEVYVNDILIERLNVVAPKDPKLATRLLLKNVLLQQGENIIKFYTPQGETKIGDILGNNDSRQVSFAISDFGITPSKIDAPK